MKTHMRLRDIQKKADEDQPIVMLTAYDYTFASLIDECEVDIVLVGDSLACAVRGEENTLAVTLDEMIYHSRMVSKACKRSLVVSDMPFMSYQSGPRDALLAAGRLVKESAVAAVKLEGGKELARTIKTIVRSGIPVLGHVGLLPQHYHALSGYRVQGKTSEGRNKIIADAIAVQEAGAFGLVIECVPEDLAQEITSLVSIPTIGIGAGPHTSGQVLVLHDLLGLHPQIEHVAPKFVRAYAELGLEVSEAVKKFSRDVRSRQFPESKQSRE